MKKKLKALLQGKELLNNTALDRLKKTYESAKTKARKAKIVKKEAKTALIKAAEQWLSQAEIPHDAVEKRGKKASKSTKQKAVPSAKRDKTSL